MSEVNQSECKEIISASGAVNYFLTLAEESSIEITNLKLNKLLYLAHGFTLAERNKPLLNINYHEYAEAWQYGPVIPSIYHEFKHFGRSRIEGHQSCLVELDQENGITKIKPKIVNKSILSVLKWVFENFAKLSANQLVEITHAYNSPWSNAYKASEYNILMDNDITKAYHKEYLKWLIERGFNEIPN